MPTGRVHNRNRVIPFRFRGGSRGLVSCSVCLRVRHRRGWIEAAEFIRQLRTFERPDVVRLRGALCEGCTTELRLRRQSGSAELAA
jgi:hypothetical protein